MSTNPDAAQAYLNMHLALAIGKGVQLDAAQTAAIFALITDHHHHHRRKNEQATRHLGRNGAAHQEVAVSIGNDSPSAVVTRDLRHVLAQAAFLQERLPPLEASIRELIAEVEHLRGERDEMRRWAEEAAHTENLNALDAQKERAAVVAWLRKEAVSHRRDGFPIAAYTMQERADAIERGEHRREEEK